jgi:hypothetical protein
MGPEWMAFKAVYSGFQARGQVGQYFPDFSMPIICP